MKTEKGNEAMRAISLGPFLEFGLDIQFHAKNRTAVNQTLTKEIEHTCRDFAFGRLNEAPKAEDNAGHEAQESRKTCRHHSSSRFEGDERVGHVKLRLQPARRGEAAANHLHVSARHFFFFLLRLGHNRGTERTEVAKSHTFAVAQGIDDLSLERREHGLDVVKRHGARLTDARADFVERDGVDGGYLSVEFAGTLDGVFLLSCDVLNHLV